MSNDQLMRETAVISFPDGATGDIATTFAITIPEGYAMEIHEVEFIDQIGSNPVANRIILVLTDDPDEDEYPGTSAEKVITSTVFRYDLTTSGRSEGRCHQITDAHKTLLVVNPSAIGNISVDPGAIATYFVRIWFDLVRVTPSQILKLLRQQQY